MTSRKPKILVALEEDVYDELRRRAGEGTKGRASGVPLFVKRIIYEFLGWPMPAQHGALGKSSRNRKPNEYMILRVDIKKRGSTIEERRTPVGVTLAVSREAAVLAAERGEWVRHVADTSRGKGQHLHATLWRKTRADEREALEAIAPALPSTPNTED